MHPDVPLSLREYFSRPRLTRREKFARAVVECYGVPFLDNGRDPDLGLDCAGLIAHGLRAAKAKFTDVTDYAIHSSGDRYGLLCAALPQAFTRLADEAWECGDVAVYRHAQCRGHVRIILPRGFFIHAEDNQSVKRVEIASIEPDWRERLEAARGELSVWRLKGSTSLV